jgi:type I restriction enzyme R subunit
MTTKSERILEQDLIQQLEGLGYNRVTIADNAALETNLQRQLEIHNKRQFSKTEFQRVLNHLNKGSIFDRAKTLRQKMELLQDDGDIAYIEFLDIDNWCQNLFQVTNQITMDGKYTNRYDVTLLINGFPLVQIELKRQGIEMKEAFNQINRYQRHSFASGSGLFQFVQLFVISNGMNTKYYANNRKQSFKQTFFWAKKDNSIITNLEAFTTVFLERCHLSKMICKYIVLQENDKVLMVLRPYQYYAVEAIVERVRNTNKNGYIWHTTGSGKTLTSFKAAQVMMTLPKVHKVVFVVDRKDLDYQTIKEFNYFRKGSVDGTDNTKQLVTQFNDTTKLIVTTIQKLNTAIYKNKYLKQMQGVKDEKIVFIFDECHRSQFGDTHERITKFFTNAQLFGFTGTPIFADNSVKNNLGKRTTGMLFGEITAITTAEDEKKDSGCLHKYVITDAIRDENVLKFSVEYYNVIKRKTQPMDETDAKVEGIDTKEVLSNEKRLDLIANYIIENHKKKTHNSDFNAIFCISNIDMLMDYYDLFQRKKEAGEHHLKIATIFSYGTNEDDKDANGRYGDYKRKPMHSQTDEVAIAADDGDSGADAAESEETAEGEYTTLHTREKLDEYIKDYNKMFKTNYSTKDTETYYNFYKDVSKRVKNRDIDILFVVNMFLTGFDSKTLNTLYVDKNLKYHGLIQAFSRTNRIIGELKSQGNIVCFRNLKKNTDEAVALFSNKNAKEEIFLEPYVTYVEQFNKSLAKLLKIVPTVESVDTLADENADLEFIKAFRELMRVKNVAESFADFDFGDLGMTEQDFENYKSKYLDKHEQVKTDRQKEKVSILDEIDFELELIHKDEINVAYILQLLKDYQNETEDVEKGRRKKQIIDLLGGSTTLRSKKDLIEKFIDERLPEIKESSDISEQFDTFWSDEQEKAFKNLAKNEDLNNEKLDSVVKNYIYTQRKPLRSDIIGLLNEKPKIRERKRVFERILMKIEDFVEVFFKGIGE